MTEELKETIANPIAEGFLSLSSGMIKVPLAKKGKWKHDLYGEVEFTDKDFSEITSNLKEGILGHPPYLTFGHLDEEHNSTDSHRKRGDIQDVCVENDVLYGLFDQKDEVVSAVSKGEYEYASGEFLHNFTDKQTGEKKGTVFMRVALTNSPFLPFSKDERVKVLSIEESIEGTEATSYLFPSVISLSMANIEQISQPEEEVTELSIASEPEEEVTELSIASEPEDIIHTQEQEPMTTVDVEKVIEPIAAQALSIDMLAVAQLIDKVKVEVAGTYQAQLDSAITTINSLKEDLAKVTTDLDSQKEVTQAYSLNMSRAQEESLNTSLLSAGVPAALINSFSTVRKAIESKTDSIKLSQNGVEHDLPIIQALSQLLVDAVNTNAVPYNQIGRAQAMSAPQSPVSTAIADLEKVIAANKALITNKK